MNKYLVALGCIFALSLPRAESATSSGTIGVSLTLTNGCLINGSASQNGLSFGSLDFGASPVTFSQLSTQLSSGGNGGNTFGVQCTSSSYSVVVTGNSNTVAPATAIGLPGNTARYLRNAGNSSQGVAYSLYSDGGFSSEIANNSPLTRTSTADGVDYYTLYGRISGGGNSLAVVPGVYSDTINVSVIY